VDSALSSFSRHGQQRLLAELQALNDAASAIVIDTGAGLTPWIQRFWLRSTLVLLVTTIDDSAVIDAYAAVKRSTAVGIAADVRVLANRCESDAKARAAYDRLSAACNQFLLRELAMLPPLPLHLVEHARGRRDVPRVWDSPDTPFGHAVLWLGRSIDDLLAERRAAADAPQAGPALPMPKLSRR
jgi:MinD-like ATPase involved in chromosome partitioning or flagellar assembly